MTGLINRKGELLIEPQFEIIKSFEGNFARAKKNSLWGIIDKSGKTVVPFEYDDIGEYHQNISWAQKHGSFGVINGVQFIEVDADKIWDFSPQKIAYAKKDDKIGFINSDGKWIIEPQFDKARAMNLDLAPISIGKKWGFVDINGKIVIDPQFEDAETFADNGLAPVKAKKWGFVDKNGTLVIPAESDITAGFSTLFKSNEKGFVDGLARVKKNKNWGFIDKSGKVLGGKWFQNAELFQK